MNRRLIFNISHEIRTPLNIMSTGLHVTDNHISILEKYFTNGELSTLKQIIDDMKQSCIDCMAVLDDLVLYEEVKFDRIQLVKRKVYIQKIIKSQLSNFTLHCKMIDIKLLYEDSSSDDVLDQGPECALDEKHFTTCFQSFLSNAIRHSHAGDTVTVRLNWQPHCSDSRFTCPTGFVRVDIEDTGHGLTEVLW